MHGHGILENVLRLSLPHKVMPALMLSRIPGPRADDMKGEVGHSAGFGDERVTHAREVQERTLL